VVAQIASATDAQGKALVNTQKDFPEYWAAVDKARANQALAAGATTDATAAIGDNTAALGANGTAALAGADAAGALADGTTTAASAITAQGSAAKSTALQLYQSAGAARAMAQAQAADATAAADVAAAHVNAKGAVAGHAAATKDAATATKDAAAAARAATTENNADAKAATASGTAHTAAGKAIDAHTKAVDASAKAAAAAAKASGGDQAAQDAAAESARQAAQVHEIGTKWLLAVADAEASASGSASDLDQSVKDEVSAMKDAQTAASTLKDGLDALNGVHIAASKAAIDVQQKIADLTKAFSDNGRTLDITTEAGRKNVTAIDDMASAANAHAQSVAEESGSIEAGNKALDASRTEFDAVLKSAGFSTTQIDEFNKTLLNTPKLAPVTVTADTSEFEARMQQMADRYGYIQVHVGGGSGGRAAFATGGLVTGAGTTTSDSNMIAVSNREYVVNAEAVARPGALAQLNAMNFGGHSASVVKPMIPMHSLGGGSGALGGGGASRVQVGFDVTGGDEMLLRFFRRAIFLRGGNVQAVLGS
jgi:hypothetical protein